MFTLSLSGITPAYAGKRSVTKPRRTKRTDHPRPCGEKLSTKDFIAPPSGSPPRMREKVEDKVREYKAQRITPAYAGKSATTTCARTVGGDHPRVCGEKARAAAWACVTYGSPPPVRGKAESPRECLHYIRITPACAGKRGGVLWNGSAAGDHPRLCGEKKLFPWERFVLAGSPPPVRGKDRRIRGQLLRARITPACAGKSTVFVPGRAGREDHPRVCGEKHVHGPAAELALGSPPRVRGKVGGLPIMIFHPRITPACAGKSLFQLSAKSVFEDHPRVCGEKILRSSSSALLIGSPPRVRGKVRTDLVEQAQARITPACAGKRPTSRRSSAAAQDHPRVCGEKSSALPTAPIHMGSPPRVRGKDRPCPTGPSCCRITPACAGKRNDLIGSCRRWRDHPRVCGEKF